MSFRHTYITNYMYRHGQAKELAFIKDMLEKHGTVNWSCSSNNGQLGYFHGVIKDSNSFDVKEKEGPELIKELKSHGIDIAIVYE